MRRRDSDRHADAEFVVADVPRQVVDIAGETLSDRFDEIERRSADDHDELVSAIPPHQVLRTRAALEERTDVAENAIADDMTKRVVDALEIVEIEQEQADRSAAADQLLGLREEDAAIEQTGELIA